MQAFHNDPAIKAEYLSRVEAHAAADEIVKGRYWQDGKGCAVGCTIHGEDHERYETELGIPVMLARLEDVLFEGMANGAAKALPRRFLSAIRPGADLSKVGIQFQIAVQERNLERLDAQAWPDVAKAINATLEVLRGWLHGRLDRSAANAAVSAAVSAAWSAARSAARSAESAAVSAAWSAARSVAESAARGAARSAWSVAESAAESAAGSAGRSAERAEYEWMADRLIELLEAA